MEGVAIFVVAGFLALMFPLACLEGGISPACDGPWWSLAMLTVPMALYVAGLLAALSRPRWMWVLLLPLPSAAIGIALVYGFG